MRRSSSAVALLVVISSCTTTSGSYTQLNPPPRKLSARPPEQVELFSSGPPQRPHVDVGLITIEEGSLDPATPERLVGMLREVAGEHGCDAVVVAPPSSKSYNDQSYKVYSGTCVVYRDAAPDAR
jgi:hypothetical protein